MAKNSMLLAGAALAVLAVLAVPASAVVAVSPPTSLIFPPLCDCDRNNAHSPWRLSLGQPGVDGDFFKYCFTVDKVACNEGFKCCNGQQGVEKVEFDVVDDTCKDSLRRVTVNGEQKSFEYNTKLNVLRITKLNKTADNAAGTQICLFLKSESTCSSLNTLCGLGGACKYAIFNKDRDCCPVSLVGNAPPPPFVPGFGDLPPPPPGSVWPPCNCINDLAQSTLTVVRAGEEPVSGGLMRACFRVAPKTAAVSPCNNFTLHKLELDADGLCPTGSLANTSVNGVFKARLFQKSPYPAIKVTNLNIPYSEAAGTEVCLFLRPPCNTLEKICKGSKCRVALFNKSGSKPNCCPTVSI